MIIKIVIAALIMLVVFFYTYEYFWGTQELIKPIAFLLAIVEAGLSLGFLLIIFGALEGKIILGEGGFTFLASVALMFMGGLLSIDHKTVDEEMEDIYLADSAGRDTKKCPFCGQIILAVAENCRYCGKSMVGEKPSAPEPVDLQREVDIVMDIDAPGLAANPETIPADEVDRRSAIWITGVLLGFGILAGLIYLLSR